MSYDSISSSEALGTIRAGKFLFLGMGTTVAIQVMLPCKQKAAVATHKLSFTVVCFQVWFEIVLAIENFVTSGPHTFEIFTKVGDCWDGMSSGEFARRLHLRMIRGVIRWPDLFKVAYLRFFLLFKGSHFRYHSTSVLSTDGVAAGFDRWLVHRFELIAWSPITSIRSHKHVFVGERIRRWWLPKLILGFGLQSLEVIFQVAIFQLSPAKVLGQRVPDLLPQDPVKEVLFPEEFISRSVFSLIQTRLLDYAGKHIEGTCSATIFPL